MSKTLKLASDLIACPSVTPADNGCQEIISRMLSNLGFAIEQLDYGNVKNLWAIQGNQKPLLVFVGHTDVVPPGTLTNWQTDPFQPIVKDGYLYGRGAADMKGGIAAMLVATENFLNKYPNYSGSIGFIITSDEEGLAIDGTQRVVNKLLKDSKQIDWCIVGEPTSKTKIADSIKIGRRGSISGEIKIIGRQGHVAHPHRAVNPIHKFIPVLNDLLQIEWDKGNEFLPPTSFQISNIFSGAGAHNVIPSDLTCFFNLRYSNEVTAEEIMQKIQSLLDKYKLEYNVVWHHNAKPFLSKQGDLLTAIVRSIKEVVGIDTIPTTDGGTSDARFIAPLGIQVVELGPSNSSIHSVNECVNIEDLEILTKIYERILEKLFIESNAN